MILLIKHIFLKISDVKYWRTQKSKNIFNLQPTSNVFLLLKLLNDRVTVNVTSSWPWTCCVIRTGLFSLLLVFLLRIFSPFLWNIYENVIKYNFYCTERLFKLWLTLNVLWFAFALNNVKSRFLSHRTNILKKYVLLYISATK